MMTSAATAVVAKCAERSDVVRARAEGPLKILCPRAAGRAGWIVTSSFGGGLVHGDHVSLDVVVERGATCVLTTQSSTKVYRGTSSQKTRVRVAAEGVALLMPDPVVPFRDAEFTQSTRVELDEGASAVIVDGVTAGRVAFGERWSSTAIDSTLAITRAGRLLLHDRVLLNRTHGEVALRMRRFEAMMTIVFVGPRVDDLAARALERIAREPVARSARTVLAASEAGNAVVVRIASERIGAAVAAVRHVLAETCARFDEDPWARKW